MHSQSGAKLSLQDRMWTLKTTNTFEMRPCNCIGPQSGERLCPCMLRVERDKQRAYEEELIAKGWTPPTTERLAKA